MAAIAQPRPQLRSQPRPKITRPAQPRLRVIEGGRTRRHSSRAVYVRRRLVAFVLLVVVAAAGAAIIRAGVGPLAAPAVATPAPPIAAATPAGAEAIVQPGDTWWSIVRRLHPDGDPRPLVDRLVAAHGGAALQVGEQVSLDG